MRVKRVLAALLLLCAVTMSADAAAQTQMNVYFAANAMDEETAGALMELTRQAFPQAQWRAIGPTGERDLRALILGDDMPDLIVCAPSEASLWVSDGLFIALDGCLTDAPRISERPDSEKSMPELAVAALVNVRRGLVASKLLPLSSGVAVVDPPPCSDVAAAPMAAYAYTPLAPGREGSTMPNQPSSGMAHALAPPPPVPGSPFGPLRFAI